jgi:hypothetical protein
VLTFLLMFVIMAVAAGTPAVGEAAAATAGALTYQLLRGEAGAAPAELPDAEPAHEAA